MTHALTTKGTISSPTAVLEPVLMRPLIDLDVWRLYPFPQLARVSTLMVHIIFVYGVVVHFRLDYVVCCTLLPAPQAQRIWPMLQSIRSQSTCTNIPRQSVQCASGR